MSDEEKNSLEKKELIKKNIGMPARVTPNEVFEMIDKVMIKINDEPAPGLLERIINKPARERAAEIERAKTSAISTRKELIDGLHNVIKTYVDTHEGDLRVRGIAFILTTFSELRDNLHKVVQHSIVTHFEIYSDVVDRIKAIKNLTDEQKSELIKRAIQRATESEDVTNKNAKDILKQFFTQVKSITAEIGRPIDSDQE